MVYTNETITVYFAEVGNGTTLTGSLEGLGFERWTGTSPPTPSEDLLGQEKRRRDETPRGFM